VEGIISLHCLALSALLIYVPGDQTSVTAFGDNLNIINTSGIVVVFSGMFLYKFTLHVSKTEQQNMDEGEIEATANFSRVGEIDIYEDEELPKRIKRGTKDADTGVALHTRSSGYGTIESLQS